MSQIIFKTPRLVRRPRHVGVGAAADVIYRLLPGDRLAARIEGLRGGSLRGIDFPMKRVPCEQLAGPSGDKR